MKPSDNQPEFKGPEALEAMIAAAPDAPAAVTADLVPTMSSLQIAEITGKRHADVLRDISNTLSLAGIDERKFASVYLAGNGQKQPCFLLPRRECDLVMSGYSVPYRLAIIDRWQELEIKVAAPRDPIQSLQDPNVLRSLLLTYSEKVIDLENAVSTLTPKAEALDLISASDGMVCLSTTAKILEIPQRKFFQWLHSMEWIFQRRNEPWVPYAHIEKKGFLYCKKRTIEQSEGDPITSYQTYVTPAGIAELAKIKAAKGASK